MEGTLKELGEANKYCNLHGLNKLEELSEIVGVPKPTLYKWWHTKNKTFICLVAGAVYFKAKQ